MSITPVYDHYTGSNYEDNYVWGPAMNLCWTELCKTIIKAPLELNTTDEAALATTASLNQPVCTTADLDEPAYYLRAGFGPATVRQINREVSAKFPEKSFSGLSDDIREEDIIAYACFYKKLAYAIPFIQEHAGFNGTRVEGFGASVRQKSTIEVLDYQSDKRFIIRIKLQQPEDELILAKGFDTEHPAEVLGAIRDLPQGQKETLGENDYFRMPILSLRFRRDYTEMTGRQLKNKGFEAYSIGLMYENIAFALDEKGVKVENEAVIMMPRGAAYPQVTHRYFYLDKPFWVILKRKSSRNPYFLMGVRNTSIMKSTKI